MTDCSIIQPSHPTFLDDEIAALALQLEELTAYSQESKGKHAIDQPPDLEVAFASFHAELEDYRMFLTDHQLAESIGAAVHTDGALISTLTSKDMQVHKDRQAAIQISERDHEMESLPRSVRGDVQDWMSSLSETFAASSVVDYLSDEETEAGPSMSFAERQASALGRLAQTFQCTACTSRTPVAYMVTAKCSHRYCVDCVRSLFIRSCKDESLFPPRCCRQPIPLPLIARHLSAEELGVFESASVEFATCDRVYCSNIYCGKFVPPNQIRDSVHQAVCEVCGQSTCSICKSAFHKGVDCPDDPAIQETRELARTQGWQTCYSCNRIVMLRTGCNHMTYVPHLNIDCSTKY
jgi:hypothetical protein